MIPQTRYVCEFDLDCITHSSHRSVFTQKLTNEEKTRLKNKKCYHDDCKKDALYLVSLVHGHTNEKCKKHDCYLDNKECPECYREKELG